jgi:hypothetical protein
VSANVQATIAVVVLLLIVVVVGIWIWVAVLVGLAAERKDRSFVSFFLIALCNPLLTAIIVAILPPGPDWLISKGRRQGCPDCAEAIRLEAVKCPYCGSNEVEPVVVAVR